ncbi:MAG TPA: nucleotidyltransferase family protein [Ignavibacteria bacterium]|nr:nucleotidyltransferase [Bacteroidota bacterium]HRE11164.1 nucleotidyltransferase family protein [Ignavibacteria bacterium]HRF64794.1 nucleotidyltransferase family protein [Ignavibacteria bacterium]HRJ05215.1 nucleotidyltransferase family protein [Ignavibacteria bacterium]HRJ85778.1 nucleotidyltransferase family protein [Ignavibacteria bacterium]
MSEETVNKIRKFFKDKPVIKAYLFGSYARNEQDEKSDIDILVELDHTKSIGLYFVTMKMELEEILGQKIDLVSAGGVSNYIKPIIDNEIVLIYERCT